MIPESATTVIVLAQKTLLSLVLFLLSCYGANTAAQQEIVALPSRAGVTQSYFLTSIPKNLQAAVILFPGSGGTIALRSEKGKPRFNPGNFLVRSRSEFIKRGAVAAKDAMDWGFSGPMLRASGVDWDLRRALPYLHYDEVDFEVPVYGNGDVYDRYKVHMDEMRQSARIARASSSTGQREATGRSRARFSGNAEVSERISRYGRRSSVKRSICGTSPTVDSVIRSPRKRSPHGWRRTSAARITLS